MNRSIHGIQRFQLFTTSTTSTEYVFFKAFYDINSTNCVIDIQRRDMIDRLADRIKIHLTIQDWLLRVQFCEE